LAAAMLRDIAHEGLRPCKYLVADCLYGHSPTCVDAVDACLGLTALVAIPSATRCWLQRPQTQDKTYTYQGAARAKRIVMDPDSEPSLVAPVAARLPASRWYRRKVSEGTKGPIEYNFARQRVTLCKDGLPDRTVWLGTQRPFDAEPAYAYAMSHAPARPPLRTLVWLSGLRWAVEQCFAEGKTELGMDHYEVRKYAGWHHHMLTTMRAHFCLWHLKLHLGKKSPRPHGVAVADVVGSGVTLADVQSGRCPQVSRLAAAAPSQSLSGT